MGIDMLALRDLALRQYKKRVVTEEDLLNFLQLWWSNKYNLPSNHPLFLDRTMEEHIIDYYLDDFKKDPESTKIQTLEELEADEAELKKELGEDFSEEYDYYLPPNEGEVELPKEEEEFFKIGEEE
jgi:hypothetical protein